MPRGFLSFAGSELRPVTRQCCERTCTALAVIEPAIDRSDYPVFKGPATLYALRTMPDENACVLTRASSRGSTLSEKKRLPRPARVGRRPAPPRRPDLGRAGRMQDRAPFTTFATLFRETGA